MWWHFSITTGPLSRDASRHRSSVRISLSAVYEKTCKQVDQLGINYVNNYEIPYFLYNYSYMISQTLSQSFNSGIKIKAQVTYEGEVW